MKIGLISPKSSFLGINHKFVEFWNQSDFTATYRNEWSGLSVALCIIAALTPKEHEVEIIDDNIEEIDFSKKYDLIGITAITQQATRAYEIADLWRKQEVTVVMGGIHASVMPEEAKQHVDSVVIGEAEDLWGQLLRDFKNGELKPFYKSSVPVDFSKSVMPSYELLKEKKYNLHWIQISRGCPFDCVFCAASKVYGFKYRMKQIESVIKEIEYIQKIYPDSRISFADDNMFYNRRFSKELLKRIIPYKIRYMAQTDITIAKDDELLALIKESGCTFIFVGLESLSENNLEGIDKNNKKRKYLDLLPKYIEKIQSYGIGIMGAFIVGLEDDDTSTFDRIGDFVMDNTLYNAQVSVLTPFPGTEIRKRMLVEDRILDADWKNYTGFDINFKHKNISKEEFEDGIVSVYKKINSKEFFLKKMMHFKNIHSKLMMG